MKKVFITFAIALLAFFPGCRKTTTDEIFYKIDEDEAEMAFRYLNHIREMPEVYGEKIGVDLTMYTQSPGLIWNDTLAQVARAKAMDMAKRDYLSTVTPEGKGMNLLVYQAGYVIPKEWYENPKENYFELIQGGAKTGDEAIKDLMAASRTHREKLLGKTDFTKDALDCGIGFVRSYKGTYRSYISIVIAKHEF